MKCLWGLLLILLCGQAQATPELVIYTQNLEPYHYMEDGKPRGINYELVRRALDDEGIRYRIERINWARAVKLVQETPNTALLTLPRNIHRETQFKWVGPLLSSQPYFYRLKQNDEIQLTTLNDAVKLRIAVVRNGEWHQRLLALGMNEGELLFPVTHISDTYNMLFMGRVELIPGSDITMPFMAQEAGYGAELLSPALTLPKRSIGNHLAFNINTDEHLVRRLNRRIEQLKEQGLLDKLKSSYQIN